MAFCNAILEDAMRERSADASIIGFGFAGDANCNLVQWTPAFSDCRNIRLHYGSPSYMFGRRRKGGDLMIGCASHGEGDLTFYENACDVQGREEQHDPMIMAWQFKCSESHQLNALPAKTLQQIAIGAEAHADDKA